jgi:prepilin-type N-terminal cleavage/methylation domain-containing protein
MKLLSNRCPRSRSAFTLVELLVVIGIIALLISILLPSLRKAREASKRINCMSNLRQIATACFNYAADNKGQFPPRHHYTSVYYLTRAYSFVNPNQDYRAGIGLLLPRYLTNARVAYCPWQKSETFAYDGPFGWEKNWPFTASSPSAAYGIISGYMYIGSVYLTNAAGQPLFDGKMPWWNVRRKVVAHEPLAYDPYYFDTVLGTMFEHGGGYCVVFGDSSAKYIARTKELENLMRLPARSSDDETQQKPIMAYFKRN